VAIRLGLETDATNGSDKFPGLRREIKGSSDAPMAIGFFVASKGQTSKSRRTAQRFETSHVLICGAGSIALRNVIAKVGFVAIRLGLETERDADTLLFS
jgi:hypothetical protein